MKGKYDSFRDMEVWQLAHRLSLEIDKMNQDLPRYEDYAFNSQIRRSCTSVSSNIAEAFGRKTKKDKSHFYIVSRGSAYETQNHIIYGDDVNYYDSKASNELISEYDDLIHQLNKILKTLS